MKELSIEEKARRYDEAIQRARNIVNSINVKLIGKDSFEAVFPELKESEDERIREAIICALKHYYIANTVFDGFSREDMIAWLEKQCDQKPAEWSEEDENIRLRLIDYLYGKSHLAKDREDGISWLKSLKDRYTWKPSDEQMQALSNAGNSFRPFEEGHKVLWSLYNDLKKLREE